jgi:hypothetical protein
MKNNYLSYLKTKQNPNLGCKKYYSEEEIEEIHHNNLQDTKLTVNIGNYILDPDKNCSAGFGILVPIPNTKDFSGDYTYYNKTTYYIDEIKTINYLGTDIPAIMFMTYIFNPIIHIGTWCILAIQCIPPEGSSVILKKPIDNVNRIYKLFLSKGAEDKIKIEDITSFCWAMFIMLKDTPFSFPFIELYFNHQWSIGTEYEEKNKTVNIQITPDVKHSNAIIIKNKLIASKYCKTKSVPRNPLQGYRKQLITENYCEGDMVKPQPINTVYKDNYAKSCGSYRKEGVASNDFCYNNVIKSVQNKNGQINQAYNYSSVQYYSRFCANDCSNNCNIVYKKNNPKFSTQGAVSGGSRLNRLKYQTITKSQQIVKDYNKVHYEIKIIDSYSENYSLDIGKWIPTLESILYGFTGENGSITPNLFKNLTITLCYFQKNVNPNNYQFIIEFSQKLDNILKPSEISSLSFLIKYKDIRVNIPFSGLTCDYQDPPNFQYVFSFSSNSQNYALINKMFIIDNPIGKNFDITIHYTLENKIIEKIPINRKIVSNKVNGSQPVSIYRNTYPVYKQNLNGLVKCNTHAYNGARQNCPTPYNKADCNRLKTLPSFR